MRTKQEQRRPPQFYCASAAVCIGVNIDVCVCAQTVHAGEVVVERNTSKRKKSLPSKTKQEEITNKKKTAVYSTKQKKDYLWTIERVPNEKKEGKSYPAV
jgi:hypothetical protein